MPRAEPAETAHAGTVARAPRTPTRKQGLLGRALGTVARTAVGTVSRGTKGLARAAALARVVRAGRSTKAQAKPEKSGDTRGPSGKKR
jgi:hypothetical protein